MAAINPISYAPIDYYAVWDAYRRGGIGPIYPDEPQTAPENREPPVEPPKGIGLVFQKDLLSKRFNAAMEATISKYSPPSRREVAAPVDPALERFVANRRIAAHLYPIYVY